jgi:hypothetical protein
MKRALHSILLICLLSCGSSSELANGIVVHLKDGSSLDGTFLYMRDTSLIIEEQFISSNTSYDSIYLHRYSISNFRISSIDILRPNSWESGVLGGLLGGFAGCLVGAAIDKGDGSGGGHPNFDGFAGGIIGLGVGVAVGVATGIAFDNIAPTASPDHYAKWQRFRNYAKYPHEEPDELKKIR